MNRMAKVSSSAVVVWLCISTTIAFAGTVKGVVKLEGAPPGEKKIDMSSDPQCASTQKGPEFTERYVVDSGTGLANVFLRIKSGLPAVSHPLPKDPVVLDQKGCHYTPHVVGAMKGQTVKILNSDGTIHNVHSFSKVNPAFNMAMPPSMKEKEKVFQKSEGMFNVKCDIHPWMEAWIGVVDHPYFAVSKTDGSYQIEGLPAGTYELEAWHERAGIKSTKFTVTEKDTVVQNFSFSASKK